MKKRWTWPLAIWAAAISARLTYLLLLKDTPFFGPLTPHLDDGAFWVLANKIAAGDWWCRVPEAAYRVPAYPYFLALIIRAAGPNLWAVHLTQILIGSLTPVMVYFLSGEIFGSGRARLISGFLAALYTPLVVYDSALLGESLAIFLSAAGLLCLTRAAKRAGRAWRGYFWGGLLLGAAALFRPNIMIPAALLAVAAGSVSAIQNRSVFKTLLVTGVFIAGVTLALTPNTIRNARLHDDFLPLGALGGVNLYFGNHPGADGKFTAVRGIGTTFSEIIRNSQRIAEAEYEHGLKPSQASAFWVRKTLDMIRRDPSMFVSKLGIKAGLLVNRAEIPDIVDLDFLKIFVPMMRWSPVGYGVVAVLGLCGFVFLVRSGSSVPRIYLDVFFVGYAVSVLIFFVTGRVRLPVVLPMMLYAGWLVESVRLALTERRTRLLVGQFAAAVIIGAAVFWPTGESDHAMGYNSLGVAMSYRGITHLAEKYFREAIRMRPDYPTPYKNLSILYRDDGNNAEAQRMGALYESMVNNQN
ncbi:MAG: glycosyltransferase family 39 protein [Candidatus Omnitrophica bacterium]|nr:glycosyltransferase family 39 protein [Candidatus Omnitrophota bacterium]